MSFIAALSAMLSMMILRISPGSEGTLEAISQMMTDLPDLKIAVVGHTDNVGGYEPNLDLSKRRADAVVAELVTAYSIDVSLCFAAGASLRAPICSSRPAWTAPRCIEN